MPQKILPAASPEIKDTGVLLRRAMSVAELLLALARNSAKCELLLTRIE